MAPTSQPETLGSSPIGLLPFEFKRKSEEVRLMHRPLSDDEGNEC